MSIRQRYAALAIRQGIQERPTFIGNELDKMKEGLKNCSPIYRVRLSINPKLFCRRDDYVSPIHQFVNSPSLVANSLQLIATITPIRELRPFVTVN